MIVKHGNAYVIMSEDGKKVLGTYGSEGEAKKRLAQIEYFKNRGKK